MRVEVEAVMAEGKIVELADDGRVSNDMGEAVIVDYHLKGWKGVGFQGFR
jgi:hypothetical protein